jgi:hypothetical protein
VGGQFLAFILLGPFSDVHRRLSEQESFVDGVEKKPLVSGVERIDMCMKIR